MLGHLVSNAAFHGGMVWRRQGASNPLHRLWASLLQQARQLFMAKDRIGLV